MAVKYKADCTWFTRQKVISHIILSFNFQRFKILFIKTIFAAVTPLLQVKVNYVITGIFTSNV